MMQILKETHKIEISVYLSELISKMWTNPPFWTFILKKKFLFLRLVLKTQRPWLSEG